MKKLFAILISVLVIAVVIGIWYYSRDARYWYNKGMKLSKAGKHEESLKAFEKALSAYDEVLMIHPEDTGAWYDKCFVLTKLARYDEAIKFCSKAIEIKPDNTDVWYKRALVYSLKKDKANTLNDLAKTISLDIRYKEYAKTNEYFQWLWEDEDFKKLTQ